MESNVLDFSMQIQKHNIFEIYYPSLKGLLILYAYQSQ